MNIVKLLLFMIIGVILWRMVRLGMRILGGGGLRGGVSPHGPGPSRKHSPDYKEIQDAEFEDITGKEPPKNPPPKP